MKASAAAPYQPYAVLLERAHRFPRELRYRQATSADAAEEASTMKEAIVFTAHEHTGEPPHASYDDDWWAVGPNGEASAHTAHFG